MVFPKIPLRTGRNFHIFYIFFLNTPICYCIYNIKRDPKDTLKAVNELTGLDIQYYVTVKTEALIKVVDAIGGVDFDVPIDMKYDDPTQDLEIDLQPGMQKIDGAKAEQLLRFRHNNDGSTYPSEYGNNDFGRMRTQREFIRAVTGQIGSKGSLSTLNKMATAVFKNLETNMPLTKALGYVPHALKFDASSIRTEQLPGVSDKLNSLWFYKSSAKKTAKLVEELIAFLDMEEKYVDKNCNYRNNAKRSATENCSKYSPG